MVVVRRTGDDPSVRKRHVHFEHGFVNQTVTKRRRLDADPGHGAAYGDRLELWHHTWHDPVGQRGLDECVVGSHALHVDPAVGNIDVQHVDQVPGRQSTRFDGPVTEQVGQWLVQRPLGTILCARTGHGIGERLGPASVVRGSERVACVGRNHPAARGAEDSPSRRLGSS